MILIGFIFLWKIIYLKLKMNQIIPQSESILQITDNQFRMYKNETDIWHHSKK